MFDKYSQSSSSQNQLIAKDLSLSLISATLTIRIIGYTSRNLLLFQESQISLDLAQTASTEIELRVYFLLLAIPVARKPKGWQLQVRMLHLGLQLCLLRYGPCELDTLCLSENTPVLTIAVLPLCFSWRSQKKILLKLGMCVA